MGELTIAVSEARVHEAGSQTGAAERAYSAQGGAVVEPVCAIELADVFIDRGYGGGNVDG